MKNSKRFRRSQDNQKHCKPHVSKYAAKQAAKYDRDEEAQKSGYFDDEHYRAEQQAAYSENQF